MLTNELLTQLHEYVDKHIALCREACKCMAAPRAFARDRIDHYKIDDYGASEEYTLIEDFIQSKKKPSFQQLLFGHIDRKGLTDTELYKKAGVDRRHFSKIRSTPGYHPGKHTAIALSLALELERAEADELLTAAGYTLSDSDIFDLVIAFCFERKIYALDDVNQALDYFSLKPLAGVIG